LLSIDEELKKELGENAKKVIMPWSFVPEVQRKIEQVGSGYEKLKVKYAKLAEKMS